MEEITLLATIQPLIIVTTKNIIINTYTDLHTLQER